jgi:transcriptional regulator with XRE-family HTH domain
MGGISIIAKRLKEARERAGDLSQEQLGLQAGINPSTASERMNQYERGVHSPDLLILTRIGAVLHVPLAYFYCEDDQLADLIRKFSALGTEQRKQLIDFLDGRYGRGPSDSQGSGEAGAVREGDA